MFTFLDLLVVVALVLATMMFASIILMFVIKNDTAKRVFFYVASALSIYMSTVAIRIGLAGEFIIQMGVGFATIVAAIATIVLERKGKDSDKMFLAARVASAVTLVAAFINALIL